MWSERDRRYGGLRNRYRDLHWGQVRCMDPLRHCPVAFASDLHYENWLLHWAKPGIGCLIPHSAKLTCLDRGRLRSLSPDLQFSRDGIEIQIVVTEVTSGSKSRAYTLQRIAEAHEFRWSVRTRDVIRERPILLDNLDHLRQCAEMHADDPTQSIMRTIESVLRKADTLPLARLRKHLGPYTPETLIDSVLIRLHATGHIKIDLAEAKYGDDTTIARR